MTRRWFSRQPGRGSLEYFGYILALVGGILLVLFSIAAMLSLAINLPFQSPVGGYFGAGILSLILGLVAVVGSKRIGELIWAIVLLIIGFLAGGIGGLMVLIGGLLGLLSRYV